MSSPAGLTTNSAPLVSVAVTTYNSERWLARALDSVLMQTTRSPIEVVIGDDHSSDATLEVARSYCRNYPALFRVLERNEKLGIQRNYFETFEQCRGKFIAWLDADDYWTDPLKLNTQAETLEADDSISVCCHFVRWMTHDGKIYRNRFPDIAAGRYGLNEILHHNFLPSPSVMFRNGIHRKLPSWYFDLAPTTDWPIFVLAALSGDIVLLDRVMADYTLTSGSTLTSKGDLVWCVTDARFYDHIESILPTRWKRLARAEKGKRHEAIAYLLRKQGDLRGSRDAAAKAFLAPSLADNFGSKTKALVAASLREAQGRLRRAPASSTSRSLNHHHVPKVVEEKVPRDDPHP
jgi:glycosyltransferase involved in cell wall biosynthesis